MARDLTAIDRTPLYELHAVVKAYGQGDGLVTAVAGVDLVIGHGEFMVVAGPSGSGKTTLLQLLGALDRPSSGRILFEGRDLEALGDGDLAQLRRETLGFVFQQFNLIPTLTAVQNVEVALAPAGVPAAERHARARGLLERVGLSSRAEHLPSQLSGGEQQRVGIARALANEPRVLLADEPTGNLDTRTGEDIVAVLRALSDKGLSVVLITHDSSIAKAAGRVVQMRDGSLLTSSDEEPAAEGVTTQ